MSEGAAELTAVQRERSTARGRELEDLVRVAKNGQEASRGTRRSPPPASRSRRHMITRKRRPAEEEAPERTVGLLEELVLAAGAREHGAELGVGERAGQGHEAPRDPEQRG